MWFAAAQKQCARLDIASCAWNAARATLARMADTEPFVLLPRVHDLGGFQVRRVLPQLRARHIGPFVFFDHMGPARFTPGIGIDVRPHPHIGLATVTYLFEGAIEHRDTLGNVLTIRPGDVNWMTAGRGIVHSERTPAAERAAGHAVHGIQSWVALPVANEEVAPSFHHHPANTLPRLEFGGVRLHVIAGDAFGQTSPVQTLYVAAEFGAGTAFTLPPEHTERAIYASDAALQVGDVRIEPGQLIVLPAGAAVRIGADSAARAMIFGGDPLDGERHVWWNFVSSSRERIERAKAEWQAQSMGTIPGETEFIPLPDR
jgi:redox-sensitive bicupin YhaK (pirin superfamily)